MLTIIIGKIWSLIRKKRFVRFEKNNPDVALDISIVNEIKQDGKLIEEHMK